MTSTYSTTPPAPSPKIQNGSSNLSLPALSNSISSQTLTSNSSVIIGSPETFRESSSTNKLTDAPFTFVPKKSQQQRSTSHETIIWSSIKFHRPEARPYGFKLKAFHPAFQDSDAVSGPFSSLMLPATAQLA